MRTGIAVVLVAVVGAGCTFEAPVANGPSLPADPNLDAALGIDARLPDAVPPPDAFVNVCAAAYVTVPAAQTQSKYRRVQVQTEWLVAKADCESDGGHLVIAETAAEAIAIHALVDPLETSPYFWAGISDTERDGQWTTVLGQPFTVPSWGIDDPDQRTGEIYALIYADGTYYDWFDYGTQEYACECSP